MRNSSETNSVQDDAVNEPSNQYPGALEANYVLGLLFLAYTFSFIDRQVLGVLVGPIKADLQLSDFQFSLLQGSAFAIVYCLMALPFGRLADAHSRKLIMALGVFFWSLMTIGCGLAKSFTQLFVMRMAVGAGEAALSPAAYSTITDSFSRDKLTRAMAFYKAGTIAGGGLALILGGKLYEYYASVDGLSLPLLGALNAWQATFISVGVPGFVIALLIFLTNEPERKGVMKVANKSPDESMDIKEVFTYMFVEHRQLYVSLFCGCSILAVMSYAYSSWFTELLIRNFSLSRGEAGSMFGTVYMVSGLVGMFSGPSMVSFFQKRGFQDANMRVLMYISMALLPFAVAAPLMPSHESALALIALTVFFQASYLGVAAAAVQMVTPNQMRGQATAIYIFATNMLGLAIGSSLIAGITDFGFGDESKLHYSISLAAGFLIPVTTFLFWKGLGAFGSAIRKSEEWC